MNFNSTVKSISISSHAKKVYEELDKIRPKHISFSLMLAIAADEYIKNNRKGLIKIDNFLDEKNNLIIPGLFSSIDKWIEYLSSIDNEELKKVQQKFLQIKNILDEKNEHRVY